MKKILVAGMSKDSFTEKIFENLVKKNYIIDSLTGFADWDSKNINKTINAIHAMSPHGLAKSFPNITPETLDRDILSYFECARPYFLRVLDRFELIPISERDAEQYFNECIAYILGFLKTNGTYNLCFSLYAPHSPTGIITYFACKYLNIPYYFGVRTMLPDLIMFSNNFESLSPDFHSFKKANFEKNYVLETKKDADKLLNKPIWLLEASKSINKTGNWYLSNKKNSGSILSRIARKKYIIPFVPFLKFILDFFKLIFRGEFLRNEFYNLKRIDILKLIYRNHKLTSKLKLWQKNNSINKVFSDNYIYFSMHYQPERTTDPEANYYTQQFLAIKLLSEALPDGYHLYVKDHPRQFIDLMDISKINFRNIKEYESINSLPNTYFLNPSIDSADIINNARIVSSCTGTALWESLKEGIPAISFGFTWHSACDSSPNAGSKDILKEQVNYLLNKSKEDVYDDMYDFVMKSSNQFVQTHFGLIMAQESNVGVNISSKNFSNALDELAS